MTTNITVSWRKRNNTKTTQSKAKMLRKTNSTMKTLLSLFLLLRAATGASGKWKIACALGDILTNYAIDISL